MERMFGKPVIEPSFPHVFGSKPGKPFSGFSRAKQHLDAQLIGMAHFPNHDFRRTIVTCLAELRFSKDVISRVLAHLEQDVTSRHYLHFPRLGEVREALELWSAEVVRRVQGSL